MIQPTVDQAYLAKRQLRKGTAGWMLLAGLGVSYVISGDFAGWNFGIAEAGWGGFAIAACLMALMYLALVLALAEMSAAIPAAGGGYSFARQAMGPAGGFCALRSQPASKHYRGHVQPRKCESRRDLSPLTERGTQIGDPSACPKAQL